MGILYTGTRVREYRLPRMPPCTREAIAVHAREHTGLNHCVCTHTLQDMICVCEDQTSVPSGGGCGVTWLSHGVKHHSAVNTRNNLSPCWFQAKVPVYPTNAPHVSPYTLSLQVP